MHADTAQVVGRHGAHGAGAEQALPVKHAASQQALQKTRVVGRRRHEPRPTGLQDWVSRGSMGHRQATVGLSQRAGQSGG